MRIDSSYPTFILPVFVMMAARATGRLHGDASCLTTALAGWERLDARFERGSTLLLLPDRAAEGRAELANLGASATARLARPT